MVCLSTLLIACQLKLSMLPPLVKTLHVVPVTILGMTVIILVTVIVVLNVHTISSLVQCIPRRLVAISVTFS